MKSNFWFYFGLVIDAIILLISASNVLSMYSASTYAVWSDVTNTPIQGMTNFGRLMLWLIPLALLALMAAAFWLKSKGKMLAANILLWVPALPMLVIMVLGGGFALLFILFGN